MPESTLTIVLRGLMVFRQDGAGPGSRFEIGIVPVRHRHEAGGIEHILRILTYKNGVLDGVKVPKLDKLGRSWALDVTNPSTNAVTKVQVGATFDRKSADLKDPRDYRWIMDLESNAEFYGALKGSIDPKKLVPIINIPCGEFYTRLLSFPQKRFTDEANPQEFGRAAAAMACDIKLSGDQAKLLDTAAPGDPPIFTFDATAENTHYEISNTPPDTYETPEDPKLQNHFKHYYDMFTKRVRVFRFEAKSSATGPSPALCGGTGLSQFPDSLN